MNTCSCGKSFDTGRGLMAHATRAGHTPALEPNADTAFEAVGAATAVLFPNGVPMNRIIEVAEWQKATLRLMLR